MNRLTNAARRAAGPIFALALTAWAASASAQSADEIIEKNLKAMGGREKLAKVKSVDRKGDLNVTGSFGDMAGSTAIKFVVGEKAYQMIDMGAFYQTTVWTGGDEGWKEDGMNGLVDLKGDELSQLKAQSTASPFLEIKKSGATVKKLDDEKTEKLSMSPPPAPPAVPPASGGDAAGAKPVAPAPAPPPAETVDCHVLEIAPPTGLPIKMYIDKSNGLVYQTKLKREDPQFGEMNVTVQNDEWSETDGVKFAKNTKLQLGELLTMEMIYTETKVNQEIDAAVFEKPKPPAPAAPAAGTAPAGAEKKDEAKPAPGGDKK